MKYRKWFWDFYSHGQFIYDKINKSTKTLFTMTDDLEPTKRSIVFKAICDLAKECQPDLVLIEVRDIEEFHIDVVSRRTSVYDVQSDGI